MTIDDYLQLTGMTGEKFANALAISPAQFSRIRRGKAGASWGVARAIETLTEGKVTAADVMDLARQSSPDPKNSTSANTPSQTTNAGDMPQTPALAGPGDRGVSRTTPK